MEFPLTANDITKAGLGILTSNNFTYSFTGNYKFGIPEFPRLNEVGSSFTLP